MQQKQNSNFVLVEDFDLIAIKKAFDEGRLYVQPVQQTEAEAREESLQAILQYVTRIDACASEHYRNCIRDLWQAMLQSPIADLFFFKNGAHRNKPNKYRIMCVVCILRENDVYRQKEYSSVDLHLMLESSTRRNQYYSGMNYYTLEHQALVIIKRLIRQFGNNSQKNQE